MMSEVMGTWLSHSTGWPPKNVHRWARRPLTGSMNMFFQTRADTVGMTKNGAMTRMRTIPCPHIGWSSRRASAIPRITVTRSTPITIVSVACTAGQKALDVTKRT